MGNNISTEVKMYSSRDVVFDNYGGNRFDCDLWSQVPEQTLNQDTEPANALMVSTAKRGLAPVKNAI